MKKLVILVSMFLLVFAMKVAKAENLVFDNISRHPGQFMIHFGHSLNESEISGFTVFINGKAYTNEIKVNEKGRKYAMIANEQTEGEIMTIYAIIEYANGTTYQTESQKYTNLPVFGDGNFVFAKSK